MTQANFAAVKEVMNQFMNENQSNLYKYGELIESNGHVFIKYPQDFLYETGMIIDAEELETCQSSEDIYKFIELANAGANNRFRNTYLSRLVQLLADEGVSQFNISTSQWPDVISIVIGDITVIIGERGVSVYNEGNLVSDTCDYIYKDDYMKTFETFEQLLKLSQFNK